MNAGARIGRWQLDSPVLLAPMAGITDAPFRLLCRQLGASLAASEMTTAELSLRDSPQTRRRLDVSADLRPRVVQIAGSDPVAMAAAAQFAVSRGADIIDINMGCPAKKVCRKLAGSALLRDPALVSRILQAVVQSVHVPVTLKIRSGWDASSRNATLIARIAEDAGIRAIAVHGRTRACGYSGEAEYDSVRAVKQSVSVPVFANGDINSAAKALDVLKQTDADGVMIGRAARGRPWFFSQLRHYLQTGMLLPVPAAATRRDIVLRHIDAMRAFYGEHVSVRVARKHLAWYAGHMESGAEFRLKAVRARTTTEQMQLTRTYFDSLSGRDQGESAVPGSGLPGCCRSGAENKQQKSTQTQTQFTSCNSTGERPQTSAARFHRGSGEALFSRSQRTPSG